MERNLKDDRCPRAVAQKLSALWAQNVVVDNRPGGTGAIGPGIRVPAEEIEAVLKREPSS